MLKPFAKCAKRSATSRRVQYKKSRSSILYIRSSTALAIGARSETHQCHTLLDLKTPGFQAVQKDLDARRAKKSRSGGVFTDTLERGDSSATKQVAFFNSLLLFAQEGVPLDQEREDAKRDSPPGQALLRKPSLRGKRFVYYSWHRCSLFLNNKKLQQHKCHVHSLDDLTT
jgi:hypothetical protein